jgi:hypothetical protein
MIGGAVLTGEGRPVCCELGPGHRADGRALLPVVDRRRQRFGSRPVCWVAERGRSRAQTIAALEPRELHSLRGARLRRQREVQPQVLGRAGRDQEGAEHLRGQEGWVQGRRYIVCHNPEAAAQDAADREAILPALADQRRQGAKRLVGHRGFRRFWRSRQEAVSIDQAKVAAEARDDGKVVLRTNTTLPAAEVAGQYTRRLLVEPFFRTATSLLETRPLFHQWEATIGGPVFGAFLALVLVDA